MCFRIPGRIVDVSGPNDLLGRVDVEGSHREVSLSMVAEDGPQVGDWVLIHMGVAVELIDADRAAEVREGLQLMGRAQEGALADVEASWRARQPDRQAASEPAPDAAAGDGAMPDATDGDGGGRP